MLRKLVFAVSVLALTLASCGRQVTPNRTNGTGQFGLLPGYIEVKFDTQGPQDFVNNWYVIAFNTDGGGEPYALYGNQAQNWTNWSEEIIVFQPQGSSAPQAVAYQFITQQGTGSQKVPYSLAGRITPQQLQLQTNCNNTGNEFCLIIDRHIFSPVTFTGSPSPSASPSSSPSPSASPSGSPSPGPTPSSGPVAGTANVWYVNWFVASPQTSPDQINSGAVISAPGVSGITDTSFTFPFDQTVASDTPWRPGAGWPTASSPAATLGGGEVLNNP